MSKSKQALLTLVVLGIGVVLLVLMLPKAMLSSDLSQVGQGRPALVLVFENYSPASVDTIDLLKRVKAEHEDMLSFLVADIGAPEGRAFADRFRAGSGVLLSFSAQGQLLSQGFVADADALQRRIAEDFDR